MKTAIRIGMLAILVFGPALFAGQAVPGDKLAGVVTKAELDSLAAKLLSGELKGTQTLFDREGGPYKIYTSFIQNRKGAADLHAGDDEIFLIISGAAQVTLGGEITDKKATAENELRGSVIANGKVLSVTAGDMISIPRGTAHQMNPGTGHVLYVVIKMTSHP
jgi:mannose-6-phosphate isomerase-like protein (cupin superfamily)